MITELIILIFCVLSGIFCGVMGSDRYKPNFKIFFTAWILSIFVSNTIFAFLVSDIENQKVANISFLVGFLGIPALIVFMPKLLSREVTDELIAEETKKASASTAGTARSIASLKV